jgi:hypothetical protein
MKRREFLKTGALVVAGAAAVASGVPVAAYADKWPALKTLDQQQAETLLKMTRQIFPHAKLDDAAYIKVVVELDSQAAASPDTAKLLKDGAAKLDSENFVAANPEHQEEILKGIQTTEFFQKVRGVELQSLYSDPAVWEVLGYQGPAFKYGGYLHRGFNDLAWLPNPPESASPKAS